MSADGPDPSALAAQASGGGGDMPDPTGGAGEAVDAATDEDTGPVDVLLSTEPDEQPGDYADLSDPAAHAVIGLKKMVNAVATSDLTTGTPAIENLLRAGVGFYASASTDSDGDGGRFKRDGDDAGGPPPAFDRPGGGGGGRG